MKLLKGGITCFSILLVLAVSMGSCVRERDTDTVLATDVLLGEFAYFDALNIANDANSGENLSNYKTSGYCATITHNQLSNPRTIVIDFDTLNCLCNDGRKRRGKILVSYDGATYGADGSNINIAFDNYFIDDNLIMGTHDVICMGDNVAAQKYYNMETVGKMVKPTVLDTIYWNASRILTWTNGQTTPIWGDDSYEIVGTGNGRNSLLGYYSSNITKPIFKDPSCRFFTQGTIEMQPQGKTLRTIDLGEATCDYDATVTIDTKVYNVRLY
jgi:hypothetical protein